MKNIIYFLIFFHTTLLFGQPMSEKNKLLTEKPSVDVKDYRIAIQPDAGRFCFTDNHIPWEHLIYYAHTPAISDANNDDREIITVTIIKKDSSFFLLFYDQTEQKFQHSAFDQLPSKKKISEANAARQIDARFAEILYETWVGVLLASQFPSTNLIHSNGDLYRISSYVSSFEKKFIAAETSIRVKDSHVDLIVRISQLLAKLARSKNGEESSNLEEKIIKLCRLLQEKTGIPTSIDLRAKQRKTVRGQLSLIKVDWVPMRSREQTTNTRRGSWFPPA